MMFLAAILASVAAYLVTAPPPTIPDAISVKSVRRLSPQILAATCAVVACVALIGWPMGAFVAIVAAPVAGRIVGTLEPAETRRRREAVERDLPLALDLIVAVLEAGQSPAGALRLIGDAMPGLLGSDLAQLGFRLDVGGDPEALWRAAGERPEIAPLSRAFLRASRSGASATRVLARAAAELRQQRKASALERARSVGVKTAAPLGLCFLPAFVLIGIVPTIISAFQGISW